MQPSPGYDDGRWRISMETKLDKALELLNNLGTNYQTLDLRVKTLENAPKQALNRWMVYLSAGGCLYMLLSAGITAIGVAASVLLTHH